jgi:hypothetical protein
MSRSMAAPPPVDPENRRRQKAVVVGLVLTFIGLFAAAIELPVAPVALEHAIPGAAVGLLALWIGGILLGNSVRPFGRPRSG